MISSVGDDALSAIYFFNGIVDIVCNFTSIVPVLLIDAVGIVCQCVNAAATLLLVLLHYCGSTGYCDLPISAVTIDITFFSRWYSPSTRR